MFSHLASDGGGLSDVLFSLGEASTFGLVRRPHLRRRQFVPRLVGEVPQLATARSATEGPPLLLRPSVQPIVARAAAYVASSVLLVVPCGPLHLASTVLAEASVAARKTFAPFPQLWVCFWRNRHVRCVIRG